MTPDHARDLDELLHAARSAFIARSDASFDFDAGLADVYRRADLIQLDQEVTATESASLAADSQDPAAPPRRAPACRRGDSRPRSLRADGS